MGYGKCLVYPAKKFVMPESEKKLDYIDVLRGLAILGVILTHIDGAGSGRQYLPEKLLSFLDEGARGVQLFFVASAFTIFLSYDHRAGRERFVNRNFFIRRFFRIAPMYYIGICYYLWQNGFGPRYWLGDQPSVTTGNVLGNFLFLHGFNPYWMNSIVPGGWSIAVEMLFYCFIPFLFSRIKNTRQAFNFVLFSLLFRFAFNLILQKWPFIHDQRLWTDFLFYYFPNQLPVFSLGILMYFIIKDEYRINISDKTLLLFALLFLVQLIFSWFPFLPSHFMFGVGFVMIGIALSRYKFKLFVNPLVMYIGKISYSMYIVHFAVFYWITKFGFADYLTVSGTRTAILNILIRLIVVLGFSVLLSTIFYRLVEMPMQRVAKRWIGTMKN
jgi:peptidoglycan/LPS O-acetylase OafA/YrhL